MSYAEPSEAVQRAIREFDPKLTVIWNDNWHRNWDFERGCIDGEFRYLVCQRVPIAKEVGGGYWVLSEDMFPVLNAGSSASEVDRRLIRILYENRMDRIEDENEKYFAQQAKADKEFGDYMEDWARDRGHYFMKKKYRDFRFACAKDPTREWKEWEDRYGREYVPL